MENEANNHCYKIDNEYGVAYGPKFRSGTYREYNPLQYDEAQVIGEPEAYFIRKDKKTQKNKLFKAAKEEIFSSKKGTPRNLLIWKLKVQTNGYLLRKLDER